MTTPSGQKLGGLGGSPYNLVITSSGGFTGTLNLEDKKYSMPAGSRLNAAVGADPTATVVIKRGTGIANLQLAFSINRTTGELTGTLTDGTVVTPVAVRAWRNPWKTKGTALDPATPATVLAGNYTAVLEISPSLAGQAAHPDIPQGNGYVTLTLSTAGGVTWAGKLADGSAVSGATTLGPNGQIPLQLMLYTPTVAATAGSTHGWVSATPDAGPIFLNSGAPLLDGNLDWMKRPQPLTSKTRSYKTGIPLHSLTVIGGFYAARPAGFPVLGLTDTGVGTNNAVVRFTEGVIEDSALVRLGSPTGSLAGTLNQVFRITAANTLVIPTDAVNNPGAVTLKLTAGTGIFTGNFTLKDEDRTDINGPATVLKRTPSYYGVLVPRLHKGAGQFQLARQPSFGPPQQTNSGNSDMFSGQVILEQKP